MERCLLVFREQLTADQEAVVVRDIRAVDLKQEVGELFAALPEIICLLHEDIHPSSLAIYSLSAPNQMSLLEMRDWRPLYRLKLSDELIHFIEKYDALMNKLSDVSAGISELGMHIHSYVYEINQAVGSDIQSFGEIGQILQTDITSFEWDRLARLIRDELKHHLLV